jgi:hypothetical protein
LRCRRFGHLEAATADHQSLRAFPSVANLHQADKFSWLLIFASAYSVIVYHHAAS